MKRGVILIVISILLISSVVALEIQASETFAQGETFVATLEGNILSPIHNEDVGFYEGHVQIPLTKGFILAEGKYYIYAILPYSEKNLTLKIKDVYFKENNLVQTLDIEKSFNTTSQTADFNVNPGALITNNSFELELHNNKNSNLEITYTFENISSSKTLPPQQSEKLKISIENVDKTKIAELKINSPAISYTIPVYVLTKEKPGFNVTSDNRTLNKTQLKFSPDSVYDKLNKGETYVYTFSLINKEDEDAGKVMLSVSDDMKSFVILSVKEIENLKARQITQITAVINFSSIGNFKGDILAESENSSSEIDLSFDVGQNIATTAIPSNKKTCSNLLGKLCAQGETCSIIPVSSSDGLCCTGVCSNASAQPTTPRSWTAIFVVVITLLIIIGFVWFRMKKR